MISTVIKMPIQCQSSVSLKLSTITFKKCAECQQHRTAVTNLSLRTISKLPSIAKSAWTTIPENDSFNVSYRLAWVYRSRSYWKNSLIPNKHNEAMNDIPGQSQRGYVNTIVQAQYSTKNNDFSSPNNDDGDINIVLTGTTNAGATSSVSLDPNNKELSASKSNNTTGSIPDGLNMNKIASITEYILKVPVGELKEVQVREACRALHSLSVYATNSVSNTNASLAVGLRFMRDSSSGDFTSLHPNKSSLNKAIGNLACQILSRLLNEEEHQFGYIKGKFVNSQTYHEAIKCMTKSDSLKLIEQANFILESLEHHYILNSTSSKPSVYPISRSYALLFSALKNCKTSLYPEIENENNNVINNSYNRIAQMQVSEQVERILERIKKQQDAGNPYVYMTTHLFNSALNSLANSPNQPLALQMLQDMFRNPSVPLDHISFSIAIKALLANKSKAQLQLLPSSSLSTSPTHQAEALLLKMEAMGLGHPNQKTMTPLLNALAKEGNISEIIRFMEWMEALYQAHGWTSIRPNRIHFNTMLDALSKSGRNSATNTDHSVIETGGPSREVSEPGCEGAGDRALKILSKMKELYQEGNESVRPDLYTYNSVLNAIVKERKQIPNYGITGRVVQRRGDLVEKKNINDYSIIDVAKRAEAFLQQIENGHDEAVIPDVVSYNTVLSAYMNIGMQTSVKRVEIILNRMKERGVDPDLMTYTIAINAFANSFERGSAQNAENLLRELERKYQEGFKELRPDLMCYNSVIHAWAKCRETGSLDRAKQLLKEMENLNASGARPDLLPDTVSYTTVISALARNPKKGNAQDAQDILDGMISSHLSENQDASSLDSGIFNAVINARSKSGEQNAAENAESLLHRMEKLSQSRLASLNNIRPNTITFNSVIDAWSKSKEKGAPARAEALLRRMEAISKSGNKDIYPDTLSFSSVLNAHANSMEKGAAQKAENILKYMQHLYEAGNKNVRPNTICFSTVIKAHSKSYEEGAAKRAEEILRWMYEVHASGNLDVKPNTVAFTSVAQAWSNSRDKDAVKRIKSIIEWMEELTEQGYEDVRPNQFTYNTLITAIARSQDRDKIEKAVQVLRGMQRDQDVEPNTFTYNAVLSACAFTRGSINERQNAFKTAVVIFEEALEKAQPEDLINITYGTFFQACGNLMQSNSERHRIGKIIKAAFHQCCKDGQVDAMLLKQVRNAASKSVYFQIFGGFKSFPHISITDIPAEWQQNVRGFKKKVKKADIGFFKSNALFP